ncbi:MAG: phosphoesterase [Thalassotalea sp.]
MTRIMVQFNKLAFSLCALSVSTIALSHTEHNHSEAQSTQDKTWLAGDHHIHSQYSVGWDKRQKPPKAIVGGDAIYPIYKNAKMASKFGLSWMVATDHGGPNHSKINREQAYPELLESRKMVADVLQFYGLELNTPAGDHSSIIVPHTHDEADVLYNLESAFDTKETFPNDPARHSEEKMIEALMAMQALDKPPVVFAHHPARSAKNYGEYGSYEPREFRRWNDVAPNIAIGMEGAPGHQAFALSNGRRAKDKTKIYRGNYRKFPTMGGFDQMTAKLGGFWDSMLGEGRGWWITANSDSHVHYTEGGVDFWPGEYSKTYVFANKNHDSVLSGLRSGQIFVTTGDLISELFVTASDKQNKADIGGELHVKNGSTVKLSIKLLDPTQANAAGYQPKVNRVDLIVGEITEKHTNVQQNENTSTRIEKRFSKQDWRVEGDYLLMDYELKINASSYIRIRGTNTQELEPLQDISGENPWDDLWFYSNPIFIISQK